MKFELVMRSETMRLITRLPNININNILVEIFSRVDKINNYTNFLSDYVRWNKKSREVFKIITPTETIFVAVVPQTL